MHQLVGCLSRFLHEYFILDLYNFTLIGDILDFVLVQLHVSLLDFTFGFVDLCLKQVTLLLCLLQFCF